MGYMVVRRIWLRRVALSLAARANMERGNGSCYLTDSMDAYEEAAEGRPVTPDHYVEALIALVLWI